MLATFTAALGTEEKPYTKQIHADVYGDWAVHGVFELNDPADQPSVYDFTVSHLHTGRRLRTHRLPHSLAVSLAKSLAELGPVPTWEVAKENRDTILAFVDAINAAYDRELESKIAGDTP